MTKTVTDCAIMLEAMSGASGECGKTSIAAGVMISTTADEADVKTGKISLSSPLARAMIGKEEGDIAEVAAPGGAKSYEILEIKWI